MKTKTMKQTVKHMIVLLMCGVFFTSCTRVYYDTDNPMGTEAIKFPKEMHGRYDQKGSEQDSYFIIAENTLEVNYNYGDEANTYKGPYGPGTEVPVYKVKENLYTVPFQEKDSEYPNYYRILLVEYNPEQEEITIKELGEEFSIGVGNDVGDISEYKDDMLLLNSDDYRFEDYLYQPAPQQFKDAVEIGAFRTVTVFEKN
ncbi:MAG TPA: hypothetical protein VKY32_07775 [Flavobacterium sp.]|nr:hypothetical protein [Flavobacterium sp.]